MVIEQQSFAFGFFTVVFIAMVIGIVWSLLKVNSLEDELEILKDSTFRTLDRIDEKINRLHDEYERKIQNAETNINHEFERLSRKNEDDFNSTHNYINSRFDRFENRMKKMIINSDEERIIATNETILD
mgnify:CR=1 FL=1